MCRVASCTWNCADCALRAEGCADCPPRPSSGRATSVPPSFVWCAVPPWISFRATLCVPRAFATVIVSLRVSSSMVWMVPDALFTWMPRIAKLGGLMAIVGASLCGLVTGRLAVLSPVSSLLFLAFPALPACTGEDFVLSDVSSRLMVARAICAEPVRSVSLVWSLGSPLPAFPACAEASLVLSASCAAALRRASSRSIASRRSPASSRVPTVMVLGGLPSERWIDAAGDRDPVARLSWWASRST